MSGDDFYDDDVISPFADPDFLRDQMQDDLRNEPVPCAVCGGTGAWHLATMAPDAIFFGPVAPVRGLCGSCYEGRFLRQPLTYMRETA